MSRAIRQCDFTVTPTLPSPATPQPMPCATNRSHSQTIATPSHQDQTPDPSAASTTRSKPSMPPTRSSPSLRANHEEAGCHYFVGEGSPRPPPRPSPRQATRPSRRCRTTPKRIPVTNPCRPSRPQSRTKWVICEQTDRDAGTMLAWE